MRSTFSRTFFPAAIVLLSALVLVGIALQFLVRDYFARQTIDSLETDGEAIASLAAAYYTEGTLSDREFLVNLSIASQVSEADANIFDISGKLILCSHSPLACEHRGLTIDADYVRKVLSQGKVVDTGVLSGLYAESRYVVSVPITDSRTSQTVGFVMVSTPSSAATEILHKISDFYLIVAILVVVAAVLIMWVYARSQSAPLKDMAEAAVAFGHGDLSARVKIRSSYTRETEELALAFNNMASSLEKSEYQRREFVANVSHELKTPMTTIGGYVDGILDGTIPQERHRHYMQIVSDETKRLSRLVRSMLDISQLQEQPIPEDQKTRFELSECAGQVLITFEQKILEKDLDVQVDFPEHPVYTRANRDAITQVVYNLLDNGVKFCREGGQLQLAIREQGGKLLVCVANTGDTIPPEELPLVFDRFHKLDKSRSQNREGWGLGLYIVKTLICSHGEDISVTSISGRTEFSFTLPLVP